MSTDKRTPIQPDPQDIAAIEAEYGGLGADATDAQCAERYRLAQSRKLLRLYDHGKLPIKMMHAFDELQ